MENGNPFVIAEHSRLLKTLQLRRSSRDSRPIYVNVFNRNVYSMSRVNVIVLSRVHTHRWHRIAQSIEQYQICTANSTHD
jgi:hypothetical protein